MRKMLGELAGWSTEQTDAKIENDLQNSGFRAWFMHDTPAHDAVGHLIPEHIFARVAGAEFVRLCNRITRAIHLYGEEYTIFPNEKPDYDWQAARQRVAEILREYDDR